MMIYLYVPLSSIAIFQNAPGHSETPLRRACGKDLDGIFPKETLLEILSGIPGLRLNPK